MFKLASILILAASFFFPLGLYTETAFGHSHRKGRKKDHATDYSPLKHSKRTKKSKKKAKVDKRLENPVPSHDDGHLHAHESDELASAWTFAVGFSISQALSSQEVESSSASLRMPVELNWSKSRYAMLGGDHAGGHESSSESGQAGGQNSFSPLLELYLTYAVSPALSITTTLGYDYTVGVSDPSIGGTLYFPLHSSVTGAWSLMASIPASKYSQEDFKISTITTTLGAIKKWQGWSIGWTGLVAYSWFSKTIVYLDEPVETLQLHGSQSFHLMNPDEDANSEENAVKREFSRYGMNLDFRYQLSESVGIGMSASETLVRHQFDSNLFVTDITLIKVSYVVGELQSSLGLAISDESEEGPVLPQKSRVAASLKYAF